MARRSRKKSKVSGEQVQEEFSDVNRAPTDAEHSQPLELLSKAEDGANISEQVGEGVSSTIAMRQLGNTASDVETEPLQLKANAGDFKSSTQSPKSIPNVEEAISSAKDSAMPPNGGKGGDNVNYLAALEADKQLKKLFVITLAIGLIAGAVGNWQIPACSVLVYAIIGYRIVQQQTHVEKFADSLYYMGFLFTIWGLFFAFGPLKDGVGGLSSVDIITQFGIKLVTTVVALTARIVILQLRSTLSEQLDEPQIALSQLVLEMKDEIERSVATFADSRKQILDNTREKLDSATVETVKKIEDFSNAYISRMDKLAERQLEKITSVADDFERRWQEINSSLQSSIQTSIINTLNANRESIAGLQSAIDDIRSKLINVEIPSDLLSSRLDAASTQISGELTKLERLVQEANAALSNNIGLSVSKFNDAHKNFETITSSMVGVQKSVSEAHSILEKMRSALNSFGGMMQKGATDFNQLSDLVNKAQNGAAQDLNRLTNSANTAERQLAILAEKIEVVSSNSHKLNDALISSVKTLRDEIQRQ